MAGEAEPGALKRLADVAGGLTFAVGLIGSWLYLAGWSYAFRYFGHWGLGLAPLELPKEFFFQYGVWVARAQLPSLVPVALLLVAALVAPEAVTRHPAAAWARRLASAGLLATLYLWGQGLAEATADADAAADRTGSYPGHPGARLWLGDAWDKTPELADERRELAEGCYRLLFQNPKTLFLFRPRAGAEPAVLVVGRDAARALRFLPAPRDCP